MRWASRKRGRSPRPGAGLEITAALSAASQMALLYPPGCDEWIRRELTGEGANGRRRSDATAGSDPR